MNTELEVLKKILKDSNPPTTRQGKKHQDKTPVGLISNYLGYGTDYIRFICQKLEERNLIKELSRDCYKITAKGQKELAKRGLLKRSFPKKDLKIKNPVWDRVQIPIIPPSKIVKLKFELEEPKEEKLKLAKRIEKVAAFLQNFKKI